MYVCNPILKKDRKIASFIKSFILLFCIVTALFAKQVQAKTESFHPKTDLEQSEKAQVSESLGLEATIPFQKITFNITFDFVMPIVMAFKKTINPSVEGFLPLSFTFKETLLCSMPSLAP